jgi:hypothetical protein
MPRTKFVAGNWKMNTSKASAVELARAVAKGAPTSGVEVGVAPPFVYINEVACALAGSSLLVGAQDVYFEKNGAFTGEISIEMLKDIGAKFVLTGHSERRHVIKEPSELVARKAACVYNAGLTLIHCVGEVLVPAFANEITNESVHFLGLSIGGVSTGADGPDGFVSDHQSLGVLRHSRVQLLKLSLYYAECLPGVTFFEFFSNTMHKHQTRCIHGRRLF